ncbi:MAG: class II aldolase/adducin family protein [Firmicutes bacterium]|nr:class II aldolase/adducin family protein [Bacillota bacterium]
MRLGSLRRQLAMAARALAARGLVGGGASLSGRDPHSGWCLASPAGQPVETLAPEDFVLLSAAGDVVPDAAGRRRRPADAAMHLRVYAAAPAVGAVVLARPPFAVAVASQARSVREEGSAVPCLPYAPPGTEALGRLLAEALARREGCLVAHLGAAVAASGPALAVAALDRLERRCAAALASSAGEGWGEAGGGAGRGAQDGRAGRDLLR